MTISRNQQRALGAAGLVVILGTFFNAWKTADHEARGSSSPAEVACMSKTSFANIVGATADATPRNPLLDNGLTLALVAVATVARMDSIGELPCSDLAGWWNDHVAEIRSNGFYAHARMNADRK